MPLLCHYPEKNMYVTTPNITTKWFYFLQSKTLLNVRKLLGVVISFWSSRIIDLLVIRTPVGYIRQEYE